MFPETYRDGCRRYQSEPSLKPIEMAVDVTSIEMAVEVTSIEMAVDVTSQYVTSVCRDVP